MLPLLIDGYNLLHKIFRDSSSSLEEQRGALLKQLGPYQSAKSVPITVVFDGSSEAFLFSPRDKYGAIEIVYTHQGQSADQWIIHACESRPGAYVVITDDREIVRSVESNSCLVLSCQEFLSRLRVNMGETEENTIALEKLEMEDLPLYPRVSTKKKGTSKKLPKKDRKKNQLLNRL